MKNKTKIFVDGNCIVCDFEISHYKRMAPDLFEIVDISSDQFDATKFGLTADEVQKNMHLLTSEGELKIGVDAFAHIWSQIDKYKIAAKFIKLPVIHETAKVGYKLFTLVRPYLPKKK